MIHFTDQQVPLDLIDPPAEPARESIADEYLGELADSLATTGLLQPIGLRGPNDAGRYEVVWGDCRSRAARMLRWQTIAARVCSWSVLPGEARAAENMHRAELNPREEAMEVTRLQREGLPTSSIARVLRRSITWVQSRIELLTWPQDIQDRVAVGELTMSSARLLAEIDHDDYRAELIKEAQRSGATANVIGVWLAHYRADRERIVTNHETVTEIMTRREAFTILYTCEVCSEQNDHRTSVLIRVCANCARTLDAEKQAAATAPTA